MTAGVGATVGPVQHAARFDQLFGDFFARRGGDYQTLLAYGRLWRDDVEDREAWRRGIRAQARRDRLRVRTWRGDEEGVVGAMIDPDVRDPGVYRAELERAWLMQKVTTEFTEEHGHRLVRLLRRGDESVTFCPECGCRAYVRTAPPVLRDGEAFELSCDQQKDAAGWPGEPAKVL
jgi:hypothetical protein